MGAFQQYRTKTAALFPGESRVASPGGAGAVVTSPLAAARGTGHGVPAPAVANFRAPSMRLVALPAGGSPPSASLALPSVSEGSEGDGGGELDYSVAALSRIVLGTRKAAGAEGARAGAGAGAGAGTGAGAMPSGPSSDRKQKLAQSGVSFSARYVGAGQAAAAGAVAGAGAAAQASGPSPPPTSRARVSPGGLSAPAASAAAAVVSTTRAPVDSLQVASTRLGRSPSAQRAEAKAADPPAAPVAAESASLAPTLAQAQSASVREANLRWAAAAGEGKE